MVKAVYRKTELKFRFPAGTSRGVLAEKPSWVISLFHDDNPEVYGLGECSIIPGLSPDAVDELENTIKAVCSDPSEFISGQPNLLNRFPALRFALETALIDLNQGGTGLLFNSPFTAGKIGIPINGLIWMGSKDQMIRQIRQRIEEGYRCLKLKIGSLDFEEELDLLRYVRREFSFENPEIRLDANGAYAWPDVFEKLERLAEYHIHSVEQPIKPGQHRLMAELCESSPVPVALDEELFYDLQVIPAELLRVINPRYIVLKPSMLGGITACHRWISAAELLGIGWWVTSALESNIGLNAIAQWVGTLSISIPQGLGTGKLFENNYPSKLYIDRGNLYYKNSG